MNEPIGSTIWEFNGVYGFLSNFSRHPVTYQGYPCPTAEHAFQLAKARSSQEAACIARAPTPTAAKKLGRQVQLRVDWEDVKVDIMREVLTLKFMGNPVLVPHLVDTWPARLVEGNSWGDKFWGCCIKSGEGKNMLGHLLTELRETFTAICGRP
jgi:hypothetical protein